MKSFIEKHEKLKQQYDDKCYELDQETNNRNDKIESIINNNYSNIEKDRNQLEKDKKILEDKSRELDEKILTYDEQNKENKRLTELLQQYQIGLNSSLAYILKS